MFYSPASGGQGGSSPGSGAAPSSLNSSQENIVTQVKPGLVLINTTLQYNSEAAAGTGMVINADGLVLTNNHVIDDSTKITATVVTTGKTYPATVVGYDTTGDVALIRLQSASGLTTVPVGTSSPAKAGESVVAVGNAEGKGVMTATPGQITGLNKTITASDEEAVTSETLHGMIQTNADIVPGDSGGPLASSRASSAWTPPGNDVSDQQGSATGFAIPISTALSVTRQISAGQASSSITIGYPPFLGVFVGSGSSSSPQTQAQQQEQQSRGTAAPAAPAVRQPGLLHQQRQPGRAIDHRAGPLRHPDRRDHLREPRGLGRHDRRSGHQRGERASRRLT